MDGSVLGPYRIDRELGSGGMGKVYAAGVERAAAGLAPGATVALKVVHPHLLETEGFFKRFLREAQVGQTVRHENVVRTLDCDAVGGAHFLVMEYVEGQTLSELQQELDRVPEELCRHVGREVCKGLAAIHAAGVVHRDLKPDNVLITPDHVVKVMDLGVARLADEALRLSQSGAFIGSVEYAAPEQFGGDVDQRCDLHALGVLLYEIASGLHPFRADDFPTAMKRIREDAPRRLGEVNPQLSPFFEEVVHTLLAKERDDRFASAGELLGVLEEGEESAWWHQRASVIRKATRRPLRRIRLPRETAVYGREDELAKLRALYDQAKAGDGQVALVEGEAGIGKSRLIDELIGRLQADGEEPSFLFGSYPPGGAATASGALSTAFREHFGEAGSSAYLAQTPLLVPAFDAVLRGEPAPPGQQALTKESLGTCFVNATRALAGERPVIILIDDLHFAPQGGRSLFTSIAMAAPGNRVLLVGTMRPGAVDEWRSDIARLDHVSPVTLDRLGPKDLALLLEESFRSEELATQLGHRIAVKSDGNPFFAFEIVRGLREGQFITQSGDGSWVSTRVIDQIEIPSSVLELVKARVADLSDEEKDLLEIAACCGYEFDPGIVATAAGVPVVAALQRLGRIEAKHRLVRAAGRNLVFDHHQVQESLYAGILAQLREHYHGAIADALIERSGADDTDPAALDGALSFDLCKHLFDATRAEDALRYLGAADAHLGAGHLHGERVALLNRALEAPGLLEGEERARALLRRANATHVAGRFGEEQESLDEALALAEDLVRDAEDPATLAAVLRSLVVHATTVGRYAEAQDWLARALDLADDASDDQSVADLCGTMGFLRLREGRYEEARRQFERHVSLSRSLGNRMAEGAATANLGVVYFNLGRFEAARDRLERALAIHREVGHVPFQASTTCDLGNVMIGLGHHEKAGELLEEALELARSVGARRSTAVVTGSLGVNYFYTGRLERARQLIERHLTLSREIGFRLGVCYALMNLGGLFTTLGAPELARERLLDAVAASRDVGAVKVEGNALSFLGQLLHQVGEVDEAQRHLRDAVRILREASQREELSQALASLGHVLVTAGQFEDARTCLMDAQAVAREIGAPNATVRASCLLGSLPGGDVDQSIATAREFEARMEYGWRMEAHHMLWRATSDSAYLEQAHHALVFLRDHAPEEYRDSMIVNVPLHRDITAAWKEHGGEAETRAG